MNQFAVEYNAGELGVGGLLAGRVETRGDKLDFERLPLSGGLSGIDARRHALVDVMVARLFLGARVGASAFIPFKSNSNLNSPGVWNTAFHYFNLHREEFLAKYHQRSNVESTFSAIKRKYGDSVKAKNEPAMKNEVLAKLVCHNLSCLIHSMEEFSIDPSFGCTKIESAAPKLRAIGG